MNAGLHGILSSSAPIRSRASSEDDFQIPLWGVLLVVLVIGICLFSGLGALGLTGPDEPRYAAIAHAMAQTHDWITPRLWGTTWFEKPVLYYWTAGTAIRWFGISDFSARLPSSLAALLAVVAAAWVAVRCYGARAASYTLLMLPASVAMIAFARAATPDMLFAGFLTASLAAGFELLQKPRPGMLARVLFGVFLGAAVLAKGPAAIILSGGGVLLWAAFAGRWRTSLRFLHPIVIVAFCATALPWYILCALRNPQFLHVFVWEHNFQRYLTPLFEHIQPFWFFGYIVPLAVLPWTALLIPLFSRLAHRDSWRDSPGLFLACWSGFTVLFFSFSQSKLPSYMLPAIPPLLVLLARAATRLREQTGRVALAAMAATGGIVLALAVAFAWSLAHLQRFLQFAGAPALGVALAGTVIGGILIVLFSRRKRMDAAVVTTALLVALLAEVAVVGVLPRADRFLSSRPLAKRLISQSPKQSVIAEYKLPRDWEYGLHYYLESRFENWGTGAATPAWIVTTPEGAAEIESSGEVRIQAIQRADGGRIALLRVWQK